MDQTQSQLLSLLIDRGALKIARDESGYFKFKSGRVSPNFINIGALTDGEALGVLARAYASTAVAAVKDGRILDFQYVFGPAYKGIPLAALLARELYFSHGKKVGLLYDRKEAKNYADMAADQLIVGAGGFRKGSSILMVDDVITTGKAKYDALERLKSLGDFKLAGMVIAVDRQELMGDENDVGALSAIDELEKETGIKTASILDMQQVFSHVQQGLDPKVRQAWIDYYRKYGKVKL